MRKILIPATLFLMALAAMPAEGACPNQSNGYYLCRLITVDHTKVSGTGSLNDFPLLIHGVLPYLKSWSAGGDLYSSGIDIRFELPNGTKLDHDVENLDTATGAFAAWVRVPSLSATVNTEIYLYYGKAGVQASEENPAAVWGDYLSVWHLADDPAGASPQIQDATGNGKNGVAGGGMTSDDLVAAKIGGGLDFDGTNDYVILASKPFNLGELADDSWHISLWFKSGNVSQIDRYLANLQSNRPGILHGYVPGAVELFAGGEGTHHAGTDPRVGSALALNDTNWHHIAYSYNGVTNDWDGYLDGVHVLDDNRIFTLLNHRVDTFLGASGAAGGFTEGVFDELRVSDLFRDEDWLVTEYANQNEPATFYSVGPEDTGGGTPPALGPGGPKFRIVGVLGS